MHPCTRTPCCSVTSNIKDVLSTVLGGLLFGDFVPTLPVVTGLVVSFAGGLWFSTLRLRANLADMARKVVRERMVCLCVTAEATPAHPCCVAAQALKNNDEAIALTKITHEDRVVAAGTSPRPVDVERGSSGTSTNGDLVRDTTELLPRRR